MGKILSILVLAVGVSACTHSSLRPIGQREACWRLESTICSREHDAGRIDDTDFVRCALDEAIGRTCIDFSFGCPLYESQVRECEALLLDPSQLATPTDELLQRPECAWCPSAELPPPSVPNRFVETPPLVHRWAWPAS